MNTDSSSESLWPSFDQAPKRTPYIILKEQAAHLGRSTQNLVEGVVVDLIDSTKPSENFAYAFDIVCRPLKGFSIRLFVCEHLLAQIFPVHFKSRFLAARAEANATWHATNEEELLKCLSQIFSHPKTKTAVESLLSHVRSGTRSRELDES